MREGKRLAPKLRFPEFRGALDWKEARLGQLGGLVSGLTYSPDDVRDAGLLVLRSSNVQNGKIALNDCVYVDPATKGANLSQANDILICVRNGSVALIGKNALIPEGMPLCTHGAFMTVLRSKSAKFVFQLFQSDRYQKQVAGDLGATINSINGGHLVKYTFAVSQPVEQQKIADCLSSLDELIAAQASKVDTLKIYKKGLMQQLFPRDGETQPRLRFPEFRAAKEWEVGPLNHFAQINPRREVRADDVAVSFVPMNAVSENGYLASPQGRNYGLVKKGFTAFQDSDVIVAKITPCFENGKAALVTELINGIGFGSTEFHVVRANNLCLPEFMFAQIYSDQFRQLGQASMTGSGGQQRVPTAFVENYLLSVPSLTEQQRTADCLKSLDDFITAVIQELETLKAHKKGLMQQLFPCLTND
jgi:type I restriction enzyme, S subunit